MPFSGKPTYGAGTDLPELMEDIADIVSIVSPFETPLLEHLGDPRRAADSVIHEWIEDRLLPNTDLIDQTVFNPNPLDATALTVDNGSYFQVGDLVRPADSKEIMQVTAVAGNNLTVVRGYGGTTKFALANNMVLNIVGNAALEGADAAAARFTSRVRKRNYSQIFTATVSVSGSMQSVRLAGGVADEVDFQKQERTRELLRDLENTVINGVAPATDPQGSSTVRRSMNGILKSIATNQWQPDDSNLPPGDGPTLNGLTEEVLNAALRLVWNQSSGRADTILCNGFQKRKINRFVGSNRRYSAEGDTFRDGVGVYESDFGVCRVVLSRYVPANTLLLLDSSRIEVMPLRGRSFAFKPLAATGDSVNGQLVGEYTLEFRNENAHAVVRGLATS